MQNTIPAERLGAVITPWIERFGREHPKDDNIRSVEESARAVLVERAGVGERTLRRILRGETAAVHMRVADALLCAMEATELWHLPPEYGGLDDLYEVA